MYEQRFKLKDNECPAKVNVETGEVKTLHKRTSNQYDNSTVELLRNDSSFQRCYTKAWMLLQTQTTDREFAVAFKLALLAEAYTNSLRPLKPDSTLTELSEALSVDRRYVGEVIDKLFKLGVIGKFEVYEANEEYQKYWIFNPYLQFNGKTIKKEVPTLFDKTFYAQIS